MALVQAWEEHLKEDAYREAVQRSQKALAGHIRLSKRIWWAQWELEQGRKLAQSRDDGEVDYFPRRAKTCGNFDTGCSQRFLDGLLAQKTRACRGAAAEVQNK